MIIEVLSTIVLICYISYNEFRLRKTAKKQTKALNSKAEDLTKKLRVEMKQMINCTIRFRRGKFKDMPKEGSQGEPLYAADYGILAIGNGVGKPLSFFKPINSGVDFNDVLKDMKENPNFKQVEIDVEGNQIT